MNRKHSRKGVAMVFYVLALFFFFGFMALAADVGYLYTQKANIQLVSDTAALAALASVDYALSPTAQLAYVTNQVNYFEQAHGLGTGRFTLSTQSATNGNIVQVKLDSTNPADTFFLALFGLQRLNIGVQSIAIRGTIRYDYEKDCPGTMGFFGCTHVEYVGNPIADSYLSDQGWYADQAVNTGCGASQGGHEQHLGEGGWQGHGEEKYARSMMGTGTNWTMSFNGNFCYHGKAQSGRDAEIVGNAGYVDGSLVTENFSGDTGLVSDGVKVQSVPDTYLPTAVASATAGSNDNGTIVGAKASSLASPDFALVPQGNNEIQLQAGRRYYFKDIKISGSTAIRIVGDPRVAGPVRITLDGDADINGDITSDVVPTRPGWLELTGLGGCSNCCKDCVIEQAPHHRGHDYCDSNRTIKISGNGDVYGNIYAPGYKVTVTGCKNFFGRIVAEGMTFKGTSGIHYDETLGGCIRAHQDATATDLGLVRLIN